MSQPPPPPVSGSYAPAYHRQQAPVSATLALCLGITAFICGFIWFLSPIIGAGGIAMAVRALRYPTGRGLSITGLVLSIIGAATGLLFAFLTLMVGLLDR